MAHSADPVPPCICVIYVMVPKLKAAFTSIPLCWTDKLSKGWYLPQELTDMRYNKRSQKIRRKQQEEREGFQVDHKGILQGSTRMTFSWSNGYKMREERHRSGIRKEFVIDMVGSYWNKLPKKIVDVPSQEMFKNRLWIKTQCAV